jgi:hypothetical protein
MADIKQAGLWLEAGKQVRRSTWLHRARLGRQTGQVALNFVSLFWDDGVRHEGEFVLSISDLTTDDWEIAE